MHLGKCFVGLSPLLFQQLLYSTLVLYSHQCLLALRVLIEAMSTPCITQCHFNHDNTPPQTTPVRNYLLILADRYSDEFKYRPAESPVITEYLKDGRIRLRGAHPGGVGVPPEKMPLRPEQKAYQEKKKREEIKERAKKKLEEEKLRKKQRSKAARAKAKANKGKGKSEQSAVDGSKEF